MVFFHSDLPWCKVKSHLKQIQNWLVVSTHLKNMSQNGSLPQFSGWTFKKKSKPPPRKYHGPALFSKQKASKIPFFFPTKKLAAPLMGGSDCGGWESLLVGFSPLVFLPKNDTPWKFNRKRPLKTYQNPKKERIVVLQASFFRRELLNFGSVYAQVNFRGEWIWAPTFRAKQKNPWNQLL